MIEWAVNGDTLHATDADNAELTVDGSDLAVDTSDVDIPRPVDETVVVTTDELRFPHAVVYAFSLGLDEQYELDPAGEPLALSPDEYVVDIDTEIKAYLRFPARCGSKRPTTTRRSSSPFRTEPALFSASAVVTSFPRGRSPSPTPRRPSPTRSRTWPPHRRRTIQTVRTRRFGATRP